MNKILIVFTGGTIGSWVQNGIINPKVEQRFTLLSQFEQQYENQSAFEFSIIQPLNLLSENLHPSVWEDLIEAIKAESISNFDGIIITHGTDTLAYTAAALSQYFNHIDIPMLLVSSNLPLENPAANGLTNFITAIEFIHQRKEPGVFVAYKNPGAITEVHLASRLLSCLPLSSDFISVQSQSYMRYKDNSFLLNTDNLTDTISVSVKNQFSKKITLIRPYPGLDYSIFSLDNTDAILHDLYHSGTACMTQQWSQPHSLSHFIRHCVENNKPIYFAPAIKQHSIYQTTKELLDHGAKILWNISLEAAYAKLSLAYGNYTEESEIETFLDKNLAHEFLQSH